MNAFVAAAALVISCAAAHAAPFHLLTVSLSCDTCRFGVPIVVEGGTFYQDGFGNNYPPSSAFVGIVPSLEWDSYIAMEPVGRTTTTHNAAAPGASTPGYSSTGGHFQGDSTLTGGWFTGGGVGSGVSPGGFDGVMIAQLTITAGSLRGDDIWVAIDTDGPEPYEVLPLELNGDAVKGGETGRLFAAASYLTRQGVEGDTYEIWVEAVPPPGAAGLLGVAGFLAMRRRRA